MSAPATKLSPTQRRILERAAGGKQDKEICAELNLKFGTLREHWHRAFIKLAVSTRTEAVYQWAVSGLAAPNRTADSNHADATTARRRGKVKA